MTPQPQYYMNETCFSSALNSKLINTAIKYVLSAKKKLRIQIQKTVFVAGFSEINKMYVVEKIFPKIIRKTPCLLEISEKVRRYFKLRYQGCYLHKLEQKQFLLIN